MVGPCIHTAVLGLDFYPPAESGVVLGFSLEVVSLQCYNYKLHVRELFLNYKHSSKLSNLNAMVITILIKPSVWYNKE